ncbi:hypothetical protein LZ31DRAFT_248486 [Colletotrichum somersetense]|nr:hypothetical protein LZ31DRAFT_248486 [Colletotrichum somersetense]
MACHVQNVFSSALHEYLRISCTSPRLDSSGVAWQRQSFALLHPLSTYLGRWIVYLHSIYLCMHLGTFDVYQHLLVVLSGCLSTGICQSWPLEFFRPQVRGIRRLDKPSPVSYMTLRPLFLPFSSPRATLGISLPYTNTRSTLACSSCYFLHLLPWFTLVELGKSWVF